MATVDQIISRTAAAASQAANVIALLADTPRQSIYIGEEDDDTFTDVFLVEQHSYNNNIAEHPVHRSNPVADHKYRQANTVTVTGIVSDRPILSPVEALRADFYTQRAKTAWERLQDLARGDELITIVTTLGTYTNHVLVDVSAQRSAESTNHLEFTATFREFVQVDSASVGKRPSRATRGKKANKGDVSGTAATPTQTGVLTGIFGS